MNSIEERISEITNIFKKAELIGLYSFSEDSESKYKISISKFQRIVINGIFTPYILDDIHLIEIKEETNKSASYVSVMFQDDIAICFHKYGLSLIIDDIEYHSSSSVLGRLFYIYKTKVCGERINPLVIVDNEVVAFCGTSHYVHVPEGVKKIGVNAFEYSKIERIHLPDSLNELCEYCFNDCKNLVDIKFGEEDEYIGLEVFDLNAISKPIHVSKHIKKIGKYSFLGCDKLSVE